jgi:cellulose synthase/poly-beta-1,6-N-acetylglucosamine synthase-like glycosyltransferase
MIPTYNCAEYLPQTLKSVLDQALPSEVMQIQIVDDCSTEDDPARIVALTDPERISFHRHDKNLGAIANFNACVQLARGHFVHILHGDDYVLPGFYASVEEAFSAHPDAAGVFTRCLIVDEHGGLDSLTPRLRDWEDVTAHNARQLYYDNRVRTPGAVVRRSFYEEFGGFLPSLVHTADWEMWLRVVTKGGATAINQPLAAYREFPSNHTGRLARTGENLLDWLRLEEVCAGCLPGFDSHQFRASLAVVAKQQSKLLQRLGDSEGSRANRRLWREHAPIGERLAEAMRGAAQTLSGILLSRR